MRKLNNGTDRRLLREVVKIKIINEQIPKLSNKNELETLKLHKLEITARITI